MINWTKHMDSHLEGQLKRYFAKISSTTHPFVTISREFGCDGEQLANALVARFNDVDPQKEWFHLNRSRLLAASDKSALNETTLGLLEEFGHSEMQGYIREAIFGMGSQLDTVQRMAKIIRLYADRGRVVILGGGSPIITKDLRRGIHIRLFAPLEWRVKNYAERWQLDEAEARNRVTHEHGARESYVKTYLGAELSDPHHYDLCINNSKINVSLACDLILNLTTAWQG